MLPNGAFSNTFYQHKAIISLETKFLVILRVAVLYRFYCMFQYLAKEMAYVSFALNAQSILHVVK